MMINKRAPREIPNLLGSDIDRWWKKVYLSDLTDCWIWCGARTKHGYGQMSLAGHVVNFLAHRIGYQFLKGRIKPMKVLLHICDNPSCVNPDHLIIGSYQKNTWDMINKGRHGGDVKPSVECPY